MHQLNHKDDTIAAIATAAGESGIGVVRLSGNKALAIADKMFKASKAKTLKKQRSHTIHYGWIVRSTGKKDEIVDEVMVALMKAPNSYTKEDVVEISAHGSVVSLRQILELATSLGARLAEPGEFTKRAFLNGRIDLTQAEAVADIIGAKTGAFLRSSAGQLKGELSVRLAAVREELMQAYVEIEAIVNFPEDDIEAKHLKRIDGHLQRSIEDVAKLLKGSEHGRLMKEGIKIVICGRPNVGKSSLLNALLKQPRAIVSEIAGTTRDTIEETAQIGGIPFALVDTAGILAPRDVVEAEAVKRSHEHIDAADLVIFVLDNAQAFCDGDERILDRVKGRPLLVAVNKCDLKRKLDIEGVKQTTKAAAVEISALKKEGIDRLERRILDCVELSGDADTHGIYVSNLRHIRALKDCEDCLRKAAALMSDKVSVEFVSEEIKAAVHCLDAITGKNIDADLLEQIFSRFCIGK
jgi:tRNA modification GTPase